MSRSTNRNRGDSIVPTRKRQDETNDVQIEIEQGKEEQNTYISQHQQRKKEDCTQGEYAYFNLQGARGGCNAETK